MTDREKIIKIIEKNGTYNGRSLSFDYYVIQIDDLADALIAAGLKFDRNISYTATLNIAQLERINDLEKRIAKAEHRAEVAERAFLILWKERKEKLGWNIDCTMWYAKQAEKELEEEKKSGK